MTDQPDCSVLVCMPVTLGFVPVEGSTVTRCSRCERRMWISPWSRQHLQDPTCIPVCMPCATEMFPATMPAPVPEETTP